MELGDLRKLAGLPPKTEDKLVTSTSTPVPVDSCGDKTAWSLYTESDGDKPIDDQRMREIDAEVSSRIPLTGNPEKAADEYFKTLSWEELQAYGEWLNKQADADISLDLDMDDLQFNEGEWTPPKIDARTLAKIAQRVADEKWRRHREDQDSVLGNEYEYGQSTSEPLDRVQRQREESMAEAADGKLTKIDVKDYFPSGATGSVVKSVGNAPRQGDSPLQKNVAVSAIREGLKQQYENFKAKK